MDLVLYPSRVRSSNLLGHNVATSMHTPQGGMLAQRGPETIGRVQALFLYVKFLLAAVKIVIVKAREHMKMEVPDVLISSWSVVLTRRDAFAAERLSHCVRQTTRSRKELGAKFIWDV